MRLAGKVAVVTGGGSGIGRGIVLALAREGADIAIPDIQVLNAEKVAGEVKGLGRKVIAMKTDVTSAADVKTMVDRTRESFGKIDILVSNPRLTGMSGPPGFRQAGAGFHANEARADPQGHRVGRRVPGLRRSAKYPRPVPERRRRRRDAMRAMRATSRPACTQGSREGGGA